MEEVVVEGLQGLIRLKIEINIILYNPNKGGINTRFASHSIGLSVLAFSTISHDLMLTTILF